MSMEFPNIGPQKDVIVKSKVKIIRFFNHNPQVPCPVWEF